ncbi:GTP-binding protein of the rab/ypt [Ascosphaera pollenicola]|nr:GTP-binding protein of the rab/ypt [Ascosphaera pollenicola]
MNKAVPAGSSSTKEAAPYITKQLQIISTNLEELSTIATDLSQTVEFERQQPPWVNRSKELKSNKVVPPDADEEIRRLRNAVHEAGTALGVKDKNIEEQTIKIELLESRMRDSTKKAEMLKDVQVELEKMKTEREELVQITEKQSNDLNSLEQEREDYKLRLEKAKRVSTSTDILSGAALPVSEIASSELVRENDHLRSEIANLQAAIRYTREENRRANLLDPCAIQRINNVRSWLDAPLVKTPQGSVEEELQQATVNECHDVFSHLLVLTAKTSLVDLKKTVPGDQSSRLAWRPLKTTTKYQAAKQRDDYESWFAWKEDVARRERERTRRLEAIKIGRLRKNTEPPTLYQVYSDAHFSSSLPEKDVPYDPAQAMMDRAFGLLAKAQKRDIDDDTIARPFTEINIVES